MKIVYYENWSNVRKKPINEITLEIVKNKAVKKESYVAVIYNNDTIQNVISITESSYTVRFLDEHLNLILLYDFQIKDEKLFLDAVYYYQYLDNNKIQHTFFSFSENGKMITENRNYITNEVDEKEGYVDVSPNWENIPSIGDYSKLLKKNR